MSWWVYQGLVFLGQVEGAAGGTGAPAGSQIQSVWDFMVKGGPMMIPIIAASLIAVTVTIERLVSLRRRNVIPDGFLSELAKEMDGDSTDCSSAIEYCAEDGSPVAQIVATGLRRMGEPIDLLERHVREAGEREVFKLRRFLRLLAVIASVSPLMGLLGTIFGMIKAFQTVAASGEALGRAELLAKGIYEAMITTAAGLLVALPALIAYHWISAKIDRLIWEIDQLVCEFVESHAYTRELPPHRVPQYLPAEHDPATDEETDDQAESAMASA